MRGFELVGRDRLPHLHHLGWRQRNHVGDGPHERVARSAGRAVLEVEARLQQQISIEEQSRQRIYNK